MIFLDLDRFKLVNDKFGHAMGDRLLQAVAKRLQECLQRGDTLSRFGGDEFAVLLPTVHTRRHAAAVAGRLLEGLQAPFVMDGSELDIAASAGIALYPEAGNTARAMIQNADMAMYHAKGDGRRRLRVLRGRHEPQVLQPAGGRSATSAAPWRPARSRSITSRGST